MKSGIELIAKERQLIGSSSSSITQDLSNIVCDAAVNSLYLKNIPENPSRISQLAICGAMISAEIDRLQAHSSIEERLLEYCNDWAWNVGRYFHTEKPFELASESMEPPEKAIHSFVSDLNVKLLALYGTINITENKVGLNTVAEMIKELSGIDVNPKKFNP